MSTVNEPRALLPLPSLTFCLQFVSQAAPSPWAGHYWTHSLSPWYIVQICSVTVQFDYKSISKSMSKHRTSQIKKVLDKGHHQHHIYNSHLRTLQGSVTLNAWHGNHGMHTLILYAKLFLNYHPDDESLYKTSRIQCHFPQSPLVPCPIRPTVLTVHFRSHEEA